MRLILICLCSILICVNGLIKNYYFKNEQNADEEEWPSKEDQLFEYQKDESNENNDFKFDDQSSFKDSEEEEKDAANELYQFWNNLDMCNDVNCKDDQMCTINKHGVAVCMNKDKVLKNKKKINKYQNNDDQSIIQSSNSAIETNKKCIQCPNLNMNDIYCASNNQTYSSLCELIRYNCEQSSDYYPLCQDECPCNQKINLNKKLKLDYLWKYVNNYNIQTTSSIAKSADRKLDQESYRKSDRKYDLESNQKSNREFNQKSDQEFNQKSELNKKNAKKLNRTNRKSTKRICTKKELNEIGQRLFNWFGVILKNQLSNEMNQRSTKILNKIRSSLVKNCDEEVNFMFLSLDTNRDLKLSIDELYHLEHDQREKCLKIYMDSCDSNNDQVLNNNEFCNCFIQYRPCNRERNNLLLNNKNGNHKLISSRSDYMPNCDRYGRFLPLQCNTKQCWCVDKNGNQIANTKKIGKVICDKIKTDKNIHPIDDDSEIDGDDEFEDYNEDEGSGD